MANRYIQDLKRLVGNDQVVMAAVAVAVGGAAAGGAIVFRESIDFLQLLFLGFRSDRVATYAAETEWWRLILAPAIGGLLVGLFCKFVMPGGRPQGVANVIESSALRAGRMSMRQGLGAAIISATSIGCGASVGREGPAVHLGASLASFLGRQLNLTRSQARTLLGCGVASAVAASFNAPIAGVFFALEVVIGHYALSAFAPIVIASVFGTILSRIWFGDFPAFEVPGHHITSFLEFPAFVILGGVCAVAAVALMRVAAFVEVQGQRLPLPRWLHPAVAGLVVGVVALWFPEILGVGYEAMDGALNEVEGYGLELMLTLAVLKILMTALCLGAGFGGGVFSPSLFIGAMIGGAYGIVAAIPFPDLASGHGAYTLIAMGAVAAATLGAPISTILMIFEMTGDYKLTVGVMVAVVIASVITRVWHSPSFFTDQLRRRGVHIHGGHDVTALRNLKVHDLMQQDHVSVNKDAGLDSLRNRLRLAPMNELFVVDSEEKLVGTITLADLGEVAFDLSHDREYTAIDLARKHPPFLEIGDDVEKAIRRFSEAEEGLLAVVDSAERMRLIGCLHERDVMRAYNQALITQQAEEHGETI
ncbi:chloride channel protein [Thalassobaculum sp. OXR-137]|uniref:chloride channel protein n=1 Tax=Thalassobaculum sp. OXR-137 TaxID=3100173 RepID=UPI002AC95AE1|nr:chloride channel protein [Thalassobaculum sp. OXR-137]WPZ36144.1 chloride channel protein [Thalassobaculum sp. OXR-137]